MSEGFLDRDYRVVIDGEPVVFKQGTSIEEAREEYRRRTGGFFSGLEAGYERLVGSLGAIPDVLAGDLLRDQEALDQAGREYAETNRLASEALPLGTTYQDVIKAYQEDGLSEAIPEALRFSAESIGQTIPYTLPSMFAGKVASTEAGLGVASALARSIPYLRTASVAMPPSVLKFGLGAAAGIGTLALQFFGDNMQRQYETAQAENPESQVTPDQLNSFSAALAAAPQAGMDYIVIALTSGLGRGPQIAAARSLQESLSAVGATAKASAFPTLGQTARASFAESALEFPTELVQTILERAQAGLPVSMDDAEFVQEMIATAAGTLPVAGAFGSYGTVRSYLANKRAYENFEAMSEQEQKVRNEYEGRREQSLQAAYDRSIENYEKNVNEYNSKIEDARNESFENAALIESEVQRAKNSAPMQVKDVLDVAKNRNIKTDDDAFKSFVYRSTGGKTNEINEASQDELRAMRTILTGFGIQNYFDPKEEGVSLPQFTSDEIESVATGFRSGAKLTNETVRKKLHERFFSKAKDVEGPVDFTDSESSNNIASSIIEEMKLRGYAVEDDKGVVKARKPKYTESQYRSLMDLAQEKGSINRGDYERITNRFNEGDFDSFINDAKNRGDMPSQQRGMPEGEYAPLVFRATMEEKFTGEGDSFLTPIVDDTGRPVIKADAVRDKKIRSRLTAGNVVTEVVKADGYFVRDENGEIVGGSTTKRGANEEAKFLNKNKGKYRVIDQNTGNPFIGTKSEVEAEIKRSKGKGVGLPDYSGQQIENIAGKFTVSKDRQSGYAIRQFVSPFRNVKDPRTGEIKREAPGDFAQKSTITEVSFSPDMDIANDIRDQFAQYAMPGLADWDVSQRNLGKSKRDQLQKLFASEGKRFVPPSAAEAVPEGPPARPEKFNRISKREKVLNSIYPENAEKGREVLRVVESKLKEANLDKAVIGAVMNKIERSGSDGEVEIAEGSYSPNDDGFRRIAISLDQIKDANTKEEIRIAVASIMDHEMIHAMRDLDLFTMQEWNVLSNSTYRVRNRDGVTFFDDAVNRYGGQDVEYILEEAVAEMYRQYYSVPEVRRQIAGQPRTLIERIAIFMEKMYNALSGAGFVTAADAISGMKTIQSREAGEVRTIQGDRNPLRTATPVETEEDKDSRLSEVSAESEFDNLDFNELAELSDDRLAKLIDNAEPYSYELLRATPGELGELRATVRVPADTPEQEEVNIRYNAVGRNNDYYITFTDAATGSYSRTGKLGNRALRLLKTVLNLTELLITDLDASGFEFSAASEPRYKNGVLVNNKSRQKLYARGVKQLGEKHGFKIREDRSDESSYFTGSKTDDGSYEYILNDQTKPSDPSPAPDPNIDPDSETIQQWASGLRQVADELRPPTDPSITDELNIVEPLITEDRSLSLPDTLFFGYPTYGSVVETNRFTTGPDGSLTTRQLLNSNPSYVNETVSSIFNDRSFAELNELIASASTIRDRLLIRSELRDLALENPLPGNVNRPYLLNIHTTNIPQAVVGDTFTEQNRAFELLPLAMLDDIQNLSRRIDSILTDLDSSMRVPREQETMVANPIIEGMSSSEVSSLRERMRSSGIFSPYSRTAPARSDTVTQLTQQEIDLGYLRIALVDHAVSPDAISRRVTSRIEQDIRSSVRGSSYYSHYLSLENMIDTLADAGLNISREGKTRLLFAAHNLYESNQNAVDYIDAVTKHGPSEVLSRLTARLENAESERASLSRQPEEALGNLSEDRLSRIIKRQAAYDADVTTDSAGKFAAKFEVPAEREGKTGDYMPSVEFFFNAVGPSDGNGNWNISFNDDSGRFDRTGRLGALRAARVFRTVYDLTDTFLKGKSPDSFTFTAAVEVTPSGQLKRTRQSLYSSMLKDLAYENGYEISETKTNGDSFFSAKKGDYKYNLIDQSKPLTQLPFDPVDPLGVSEDNQAANESIRRRREADQELQESLDQAIEEEGARNAESERFSSTPNLGVASNQYSIPQINELSEESSNPLTMRSVGIAKGLIEPERLSKSNDRRVRKLEPDTRDRDFEALTGMFPARNEKTFWETVKEVIWNPNSEERKKFLIRIRAKFFDRYTYLGNVSKKAALLKKDDRDLRASTNAASLALLSDRANSLVSAAINNGALILRGGIARVDPTKKSLREALDPLFKSNDDLYRHWGMWMVANRSQRIIKNGQLTIVSEREINTINNNIEKRGLLPMFEQVKNDYEQWNDSVVNFMKDSGIINDELAVVFKKYADYIPFYRNMDLDGEGVEGVSPDTFKSILEAEGIDLSLGANQRLKSLFPTLTDQRPPKRLTGGDQQMVDPLTGIMQNLRAAVVAGTKNIAAQRVMRDAIDAEMATEVFADNQGRVDPNAFTVRVEGEEKYFTTDDDLLIDTLIGFNQGKVNVHPFFRVPATILREAVARSPLFIFRNLFRDSIAVWTTSGANMTPVIDTMKKFTNDLRGETEEGTYSILENAGIVGGYDYVFEPKKFERDFRNRMRKQGMTLKKGSSDHVLNMFNKLWDSMGRVSQKSDAATRQVIYEDTLQNLLNKGVDRAEAESEAIFQAMETLNFSRRGNSAIIGFAMGAIPFFNARIQGLDVMYRSIRGQYKSNRDGEVKAMNSFLARGAQIAAMTMAYTMLSADDEEYLSASEGERDQNWIINGVKLPIPFEIGFVWKTLPERMTRVMMGDDTYQDAYKSFVDGMIGAFQLPITGPQTIAPIVEVLSNYSFFTGRPVVPLYMEGRPRSEQYQYYTSEFAKALGSLTGTSPLQIEHLIGGYTGTLGSYALGVLDSAVSMAKGKPIMMDWRSDEIPVIGSLFQSAEASDGQMQRWNEFYFSVRGVKAALNAARSDPERQKDLLERYGSVLAVKPQIEKINSRLNELRSQRKTVYLSRNLTDSQKRQMLDSLDKAIKQTISTGERLREYRPFSFTDI